MSDQESNAHDRKPNRLIHEQSPYLRQFSHRCPFGVQETQHAIE